MNKLAWEECGPLHDDHVEVEGTVATKAGLCRVRKLTVLRRTSEANSY